MFDLTVDSATERLKISLEISFKKNLKKIFIRKFGIVGKVTSQSEISKFPD